MPPATPSISAGEHELPRSVDCLGHVVWARPALGGARLVIGAAVLLSRQLPGALQLHPVVAYTSKVQLL